MTVNNQEILKEIDSDFQYNYTKNSGLFLSCFVIVLSIFLLLGFPYLYYLKEEKALFDVVFNMIFPLIGVYGIYGSVISLKANKFIEKKYGDDFNKTIENRINEVMEIEDIEKYYEKASISFRKDILEPILEKEIKKKLGKNKYNSLDILKKLKEESKVEIKNT